MRTILLPNDADVSYRVSILLTKGAMLGERANLAEYACRTPIRECERGMTALLTL